MLFALCLARPLVAALLFACPAWGQTRGGGIVAAENFYGDVAAQVAGPGVKVTSVLASPDQDPHLFEASPSVARAVQDAAIVIYNGVDYDPWMARLVRASRRDGRRVLVVGELVRRKAGANPHLWYDPAVMPVVAKALAEALGAADPAHEAEYAARAAAFGQSLQPVLEKVAAMRARFAGQPIAATEPVFGYMAAALGLVVRNERFALAVMNGTEPRASDVAGFEADMRQRRVRLLVTNSQATGGAAARMAVLARQAGVPVVGVSETEPPGTTFQAWMLGQLDAVDRALSAP